MFDHCTCRRRLLQKGHQIVASSKFTTKIFQQAGKRLFSKMIFFKLFVFGWLFFCFQSTWRNVFLNYSIFRKFVLLSRWLWSILVYPLLYCQMQDEDRILDAFPQKRSPKKCIYFFYTATLQPTINLSRYINKK